MKQGNVRALIGYLSRAISSGDPDPAPLTITPDVKVEHSKPVPLSALQQQSEHAKYAMEEKRKRALSFLAAKAQLRDEASSEIHLHANHRRGVRLHASEPAKEAP